MPQNHKIAENLEIVLNRRPFIEFSTEVLAAMLAEAESIIEYAKEMHEENEVAANLLFDTALRIEEKAVFEYASRN